MPIASHPDVHLATPDAPTPNPDKPVPMAWPWALHVAFALVTLGLVTRIWLTVATTHWFAKAGAPSAMNLVLSACWRAGWLDVACAVVLALLSWLAFLAAGRRWRAVPAAFSVVLLVAIGFVTITHVNLLFTVQTGLSWSLARQSFVSGDWRAVVEHTTLADVLLAVLAPAVWALAAAVRMLRLEVGVTAMLSLVLLAGAGLPAAPRAGLPAETGTTPAWFLIASAWQAATQGGGDASQSRAPPRALQQGLAPAQAVALAQATTASGDPGAGTPGLFLDDPRITDPAPAVSHLPPPRPWNIVWIVMESTGLRYFQGETYKGVLPMPFTRDLARQGWFLSHHRSPSNSSATSIFAQFSGLYPVPSLKMFSTAADNHVPGLFAWLGPKWDRFLYTPGKLTYFFPKPFLQHSGLTDMVGFQESTVTKNPGGEGLSKDEPEVVGTFLQRLHAAREPFAAVYYSYLAHWEYTDYGAQARHFRGSRLIDRYHDNLWLLDKQIERIYAQLKADGRLDRTILVLAGDHGEAFGQHPRNWAHARGSYEENFQVPAILWQPAVFPPREVTEATLHVDLLPTVLDALGLPYDARLLQGESLFQERIRRKVSFFWGNEGTVTASFDDGWKVLLSTTEKRCEAFNLATDPLERQPHSCAKLQDRVELLRSYREFQKRAVVEYSEAVRLGRPWQGRRQPLAVQTR